MGMSSRAIFVAAEDAPTPAMVAAVKDLLRRLTPAQRSATCFPVNSQLWRHWQNTELYVEHHGLRLDEVDSSIQAAVMAVVRASLSAKGYEVTRDVMRLNRFLGDLVGGPQVLGEWAYIFCLFGDPSESEPWGWQLFGHHLCLNCLVIGRQMVLTPCFFGAEPNYADTGPFAGIRLFEDEERAGLKLMRSLSPQQQTRAIVAHSMMGGDLPPGRRHFADNLHLGGAYQDNRIVPYEGLRVSELSALQRRDLMDLVAAYVAPLPPGPVGGAAGRSRTASRRHALLLDRRVRRNEPVLLPDTEPRGFHRVRPPRWRVLDQCRTGEIPRPHHRAHPQRERLRHRPIAPALSARAASSAQITL